MHRAILVRRIGDFVDGRATIKPLLSDNGYAIGHFGKWQIGPGANGKNASEKIPPVPNYGIDEVEVLASLKDRTKGRDDNTFDALIFRVLPGNACFFARCGTRPPTSSKTTDINSPRSSTDKKLYSLATPGKTTPCAPASRAKRTTLRTAPGSTVSSSVNRVGMTGKIPLSIVVS